MQHTYNAGGSYTVQLTITGLYGDTVIASTGSAALTITSSITVSSGSTGTFAVPLAGSAPFIKNGDGTLILTATNTYTGVTTINAGTLRLSNPATFTRASVSNNAALQFDVAGSVTYGKVISGSGSILKTGAGLLTFTVATTCTGGATINGGTLQLVRPGNISSVGTTTISPTSATGGG